MSGMFFDILKCISRRFAKNDVVEVTTNELSGHLSTKGLVFIPKVFFVSQHFCRIPTIFTPKVILMQGCQMVCFQTINPNFGKIWRALEWKTLLYFMTI
jgi:hypothetical protein